MITCHSEFGKLKRVFIKSAADSFVNEAQLQQQWKALNFLSKPDLKQAIVEYTDFEKLLMSVEQVLHFPADNTVTLDSLYCLDSSLATNFGMILCNMGKAARVPEPAASEKAFNQAGVSVLGKIIAPGTLEGGDVA